MLNVNDTQQLVALAGHQVWLTADQASGRIVMAAASLAGLVYLIRGLTLLVRKVDKINDLTSKELTTNGGGSIKDQLNRIDHATRVQADQSSEHTAQLVSVVARLETIEGRLAVGDRKFRDNKDQLNRLDRVTARLEGVARTNHPDDWPADFTD